MNQSTVRVNVNGGYDVVIGRGLLDQAGERIKAVRAPGACAVITDTNVEKLYLSRVMHSLKSAGFAPHAYAFPAGEENKNLKTLSGILEFMASVPLTRSDFVIALGGGVTGDMAGFAAGCYMRGVPFVQIPTTFLSQVDSSVGGKTAVDLSDGKNLAGLFHQPELVIIDTDTLKTLSPEMYACGAAESIKMGVIADKDLFDIFENKKARENEEEIIFRAVSAKARIVEKDEKETGDRKLLNLGHTYGHAIEKLSNFTLPHGHAVSIGLCMAARAAERMGEMTKETFLRIQNTLLKNDLPVKAAYSASEIYASSLTDKKMSGKAISIIVPKAIPACEIRKIPAEEFKTYIELALGGENE